MSDFVLEAEKQKLDCQLRVTEPPLSYINKKHIDNSFGIAVAVDIPYPVLIKWHELIQKDEQKIDFVELLNFWIPGRWFKVSREAGCRIEGRLRREAGEAVRKYTGKKVGGRKREEAKTKSYILCIREQELVVPTEIEENLCRAEEAIQEWKLRYANLEKEKECLAKELVESLKRKENEMEEELAKAEERFNGLKKENMELSSYIEQLEKKAGFLCQSKKIDQIGKRQQLRRIKTLKDKSEVALWFLKTHGLELSFLKVQETTSGRSHTFQFDEKLKQESDAKNGTDQDNLETLLYLLDKFCAGDELYHELSIISDDLPRSYLIKQKRSELNKLCHIERVPGQFPGAQLCFSETLKDHIKDFFESHPNYPENKPIRVKISCDGAKISKTTNFMLMSFALLESGDLVMSSKGNRTIGIVNGPEKYETIESSFADILMDINNLHKNGKIEVNGKQIPIELFLGGDYKFLLMSMGMSGATSDYACLWCLIYKLLRWDTTKPLMHYNEGDLKRTLKSLESNYKKKTYSCINKPLFNIELDHIILHELHLMLRITDRLTENLIQEVMEKDGDENYNKAKGKKLDGINLNKLVKAINDLGITFAIWEKKNADGKGSGSYDWTSLMGSDKKKMLRLLPDKLKELDILFPESKDAVIKLWKDFEELYDMINCESNSNDYYLDIFEKAKKFINLFCSLGATRMGYLQSRVTPYMHALVYHVPMFMKKYKNFKQFTGQGVEKNNDDAKKIFFQKSNKWDAAQDVLLLEHREKLLQHCERQKRKYDKKNAAYWEDGIVESRKKRARGECSGDCSSLNNTVSLELEAAAGADNHQEPNLHETNNKPYSGDYAKMTVKQLKQEIQARNLNTKGMSKMKKAELIMLLESS